MADIKIIATDLDGTLLDSEKNLSEENYKALAEASAAGIEIVPTTGRIFAIFPEAIKQLPFVNYAITGNGAEVYDIRNACAIATNELAWERAVEIMEYLDNFPVVYDCYAANDAFMTAEHLAKVENYISGPVYYELYRKYRKPVPELKAFITQRKLNIQKMQFCTMDQQLRHQLLADLRSRFPYAAITAALPYNGEINDKNAHKGRALMQLWEYLGYTRENVMALGDGTNDITMLEAAGVSVAMGNADQEIQAIAKYVTGSCDESGVAQAIRKFCL